MKALCALLSALLIAMLVAPGLASISGDSDIGFGHSPAKSCWVIDSPAWQAGGIVSEWNAEIETGMIKSPPGSHYMLGKSKSRDSELKGIYFVDPTAT